MVPKMVTAKEMVQTQMVQGRLVEEIIDQEMVDTQLLNGKIVLPNTSIKCLKFLLNTVKTVREPLKQLAGGSRPNIPDCASNAPDRGKATIIGRPMLLLHCARYV